MQQQVSNAFAITKIPDSNKLIFHIKIVNYEDEQFQDFTVRYKNILQHSPNKVYFIFDTLELTSISTLQSLKLSLFLQNMRPLHRTKLEKFTIILVNSHIKKILDVVFRIVPPVRPYKITSNIEEATNFMYTSSTLI